jgi:hypothetical protein
MGTHLMGAGDPENDPARDARETRKEALRAERDSKTT